MPRLSQKFVASLGPIDRDSWFWDDELKGFHVRARPGVSPVWGVRYRVNGTARTTVIGPCHEVKAEKARERAREIRESARVGVDLLAEAKALRTAPTVADLAKEHLELQTPPKIAQSTYDDKRTHWDKHIIPALGKIKVVELSKSDIERFHSKFKNNPSLGNRVLATLSKALSDCQDFRPPWRTDNPALRVKKYQENKRDRVLGRDELVTVLSILDRMRTENASTWSAPWLFFILLVSGLRLSEWSMRRWDQVDLERGLMFIPKAKNKKPRVVILSDAVVSALKAMPRKCEWIFPNSTLEGPYKSPQKHWEAIREVAEIPDVRLHDLRHTVASMSMNGAGLSQRQVMTLLGHSQMTTTERYLNVHDEGLKEIANRAADAILIHRKA